MSTPAPPQALLDAVVAAPQEDAPRLAWADVAGAERGELVTLQCALARGGLTPEAVAEHRRRERELLRLHGGQWSGLDGIARRWCFTRGFVETAEVDATVLVERGSELFERAPLLSSLRVTGLTRHIPDRWADNPVREGPDTFALLERMLAAPWLTRLRGLDIHRAGATWSAPDSDWHSSGYNGTGNAVARLFATSGRLAGLRSLGIDHSGLGQEGTRALASAPWSSNLERLWLRAHHLDTHAAAELFAPGRFPRLSSLALTGESDSTQPHISGGISPRLPPNLIELRIGENFWSDRDLLALSESPAAATLQHLALNFSQLEAPGLRALARFRALETLDLDEVGFGLSEYPYHRTEAVQALAQTPLPNLRELRLTRSSLSGALLRMLATSFGPQLECFDLRGARMAEKHAQELQRAVRGEVLFGEDDDEPELMPAPPSVLTPGPSPSGAKRRRWLWW